MRVNPRVCLEVERIADKDHWTTVQAVGRFREIATNDRFRIRAEQLLQRRPEWWLPGVARTGSQPRDRAVVYEIRIDRLTGRRAARARAAQDIWPATA